MADTIAIAMGCMYGATVLRQIGEAYLDLACCAAGKKTVAVHLRSLGGRAKRRLLSKMCNAGAGTTNTLEMTVESDVSRKTTVKPRCTDNDAQPVLDVLWRVLPDHLAWYDVTREQYILDMAPTKVRAAQYALVTASTSEVSTTVQTYLDAWQSGFDARSEAKDASATALVSAVYESVARQLTDTTLKQVHLALQTSYKHATTMVAFPEIPTASIDVRCDDSGRPPFALSFAVDGTSIESAQGMTVVFSTYDDQDQLDAVVGEWCGSS
jgi:hypothetical protein